MTDKKLTRKQEAFIDAYLSCFNGAEAARRAGYSTKTARTIASNLLADIDINEQIQARMKEVHMSADEALKLTSDIARGDVAALMDLTSMGGNIDLLTAQEKGLTKLIKKFKQKTTTIIGKKESDDDKEIHEIELELYSAQDAQRDILKIAGKFIDKHEISGNGGQTINVVIQGLDD